MRKLLTIILLSLPLSLFAQFRITGRVVDSATKTPVAGASVFLGNASAGASTHSDGSFTINGVRGGQYTLIVSVVGYSAYSQVVLVNKDVVLNTISIAKKNTMLKEVRIGPPRNWEKDYERFKRGFVGLSDNAENFTVLNPHVLSFDSDEGVFTAKADGLLLIENKALGYKIKYMLYAYRDDRKNGILLYYGTAFFENMPGSQHRIKKWKQKRLNTYLGSDMHFLRAIIAGKTKEEGFTVERLIRKPNPEYKGMGNKYISTLVTTPLEANEYAYRTNIPGEYALKYADCLYVVYKGAQGAGSTITINAPYAYFDNNGIIINIQDVLMEGPWGDSRMPEMLPVDYEPGN
ncbi:MAG: carboxypeptidase-like regulatory domain-containing protein [Mucilaginibacter sp.]